VEKVKRAVANNNNASHNNNHHVAVLAAFRNQSAFLNKTLAHQTLTFHHHLHHSQCAAAINHNLNQDFARKT